MTSLADSGPVTVSIFELRTEEGTQDRDRFELFAPMTSGETRLKVNGRLVHDGELRPGMLRLSAPDDREERSVRRPLQGIRLSLSALTVQELFSRHQYRHRSANTCFMNPIFGGQPLVQRLVGDATFAGDLAGAAKAIYLDGIAEALIGLLIDNQQSAAASPIPSSVRPLSPDQFDRCVAYADQMLGQKISVVAWAQTLHLSPSEFGRRFLRTTRRSPYAWFMDRRIERAQKILKSSRMSLSHLSLKLGFASQSHFTEAFRQRTGLAPERWRRTQFDFDIPAVS